MFLSNVVASGTPESIGGALLTGLLDVMTYFRSSMEILSAEGKCGKVIALPPQVQTNEEAA